VATNGTTVTLTEGANVNDSLEFVAYSSISLYAAEVPVIDDTNTDAVRYIALTNATSGSISSIRVASTELTFNPGTNTFTTGNIVGTNLNVTGISTLNNVIVGGATTALIVNGDARVTGILTVGTSSLTLNGINDRITIGTGLTITSTEITIGSFTIGNVTGVVTATSFNGSGAGLTNIPAGQLTGALPAIDGSALTGISASGSGVVIRDDGSPVGTATTIDFGANLSVSFASGIATITGSSGGSTLGIATAGGTVGTGVTLLDFRGSGTSTVTVSSGIATINIEGGGSSTPEISSVMMSMIF
jgi:hypothetical protein